MLKLNTANNVIARATALFIAPMVVASCGGSAEQGLIKNAPNLALAGCTDSCAGIDESGIVAKIDIDSGKVSIRFATITDNDDSTFTYRDGQRVELLDGVPGGYEGTNMLILEEYTSNLYSQFDYGLAAGPDEFFYGVFGRHTDAEAIRVSGDALYFGNAIIATEFSGEDESAVSVLDVDFGAKSADLYAYASLLSEFASFDEIQALNMQIDGYSFTGDEMVFLLESQTVDITGTNSSSATAGMFFGTVDGEGTPVEFGAVGVATGDSNSVILVTTGGLVSP